MENLISEVNGQNTQDLVAELKAARERIAELEAREADHLFAEQKLAVCGTLGNTLWDSLHFGVVLIDGETHRIIDINAHASKMIGWPKEELINAICHTYLCQAGEGNCPVIDRGQELNNCECVLVRSGGEKVPIHKTVTTVIHNGKKLILESFCNTSEPTKAQKAGGLDDMRFEALYNLGQMINESEQDIMDYALEASVRVTDSKSGYIYFVNQEESELTLQASYKSAMSQCAVPTYPAACKISETGLWGEAARQGRPVIRNNHDTSPVMWGYPEGHVAAKRHMNLPVKENGKMVLLAGVESNEKEYTKEDLRQLFLMLDGMWRIIQRKRNETALKKALADAQQAQANIEIILESLADGLILTDMENRIILMSASAEELLGKQLENVYLKPIEAAIENKKLIGQLIAIQSGAKKEAPVDLELPGEKEGETRIIQAKPALVGNRDGIEAGVITILRDVSQERHLDKMKSEFIATAAHELRTPLTVVMGFSELLLSRKDLDEPQQSEYLSIIHKKAEVLGKIVGDLLDLSRVDSGRVIRLNKDWTDIGSIIGRSTDDFQRACPNHLFETVLPEKPVVVFLDDRKLFQVMENLLGNAVKFSPPGALIRVVCEVSEADIRVTVSDEGVGMTSDQVARIFEKFYRVDASNTAKEGLGLGMAIVKSIIDAHSGQIWVDSEVGKGTKISFSLPLMDVGV